MAKPVEATPALTGQDAVIVQQELERGTPLTSEREQIFAYAKVAFERNQDVLLGKYDRDQIRERLTNCGIIRPVR